MSAKSSQATPTTEHRPPTGSVLHFGTGCVARRAAEQHAATLWHEGTAARAMFKVEDGGWIVVVYGKPRTRE